MTKLDVREYIELQTGLPTADVAFINPQKLPFIAIIDKTSEDGDDYHARLVEHDLTVEFYAARIDGLNEQKIETAFAKQGWKSTKERIWINEEKMFETIYNIEFVEKR